MKIFIAILVLGMACWAYGKDLSRDRISSLTYGDRVFTLHRKIKRAFTRTEAMDACRATGGALAEFNSDDEYKEVYDFLKERALETMVLVGYKYKLKKGPKSEDGSKTKFEDFPWFEGHPLNIEGYNEMVLMMTPIDELNGFMNVKKDCRYMYFLCAK